MPKGQNILEAGDASTVSSPSPVKGFARVTDTGSVEHEGPEVEGRTLDEEGEIHYRIS